MKEQIERAYARLPKNSALEKEGARLVKVAKEQHQARKDYSRKEIYQATTEAGKFLVKKAKGSTSVIFNGFAAKNRKKKPGKTRYVLDPKKGRLVEKTY